LYAKLFTSIYQGTLRGNSHGLLVFTNLLAHCDKDGIADIHPRAIAEEVGLAPDQVRAVLDELEAPDEESRSPEEGGRRIVRVDEHRAWGWRVVNYVKYRAIRNEEDRREQNRRAQEAWRKRRKAERGEVSRAKPRSSEVSPAKPQKAHTEADAEADAEARHFDHSQPTATLVGPAEKSAAPSRRGSRLPDDWTLPADWLAWTLGEFPAWTEQHARGQADRFRDYWIGLAGAKACKSNWSATWRNWCRSDIAQPGRGNGNGAAAEPDWRREEREMMQAYAGTSAAKPTKAAKEIVDVTAKIVG
jgi:hypothetical protein